MRQCARANHRASSERARTLLRSRPAAGGISTFLVDLQHMRHSNTNPPPRAAILQRRAEADRARRDPSPGRTSAFSSGIAQRQVARGLGPTGSSAVPTRALLVSPQRPNASHHRAHSSCKLARGVSGLLPFIGSPPLTSIPWKTFWCQVSGVGFQSVPRTPEHQHRDTYASCTWQFSLPVDGTSHHRNQELPHAFPCSTSLPILRSRTAATALPQRRQPVAQSPTRSNPLPTARAPPRSHAPRFVSTLPSSPRPELRGCEDVEIARAIEDAFGASPPDSVCPALPPPCRNRAAAWVMKVRGPFAACAAADD